MSLVIKVPEVGESISEVTIAQWLKEDGASVEMDEVICELESDKATFELTAEQAGILHHKAAEGDTLAIGAEICEIESNSTNSAKNIENQSSKPSKSTTEPSQTMEKIIMRVPEVGESITEVTIESWLKEDGAHVALDEAIAEIGSDKATFELAAEVGGILSIIADEGSKLGIGDEICSITPVAGSVEAPSENASSMAQPVAPQTNEGTYASGHPSPAAAKILAEKNIDTNNVTGSGVGGRITKADALKAQKAEISTNSAKNIEKEVSPTPFSRSEERKRMSSLRKTIAKRLVAAKNQTAMLTTFNEVDMKPIMDIRKKYKDAFKEKYEVGLGFMSFFTKACCMALQEWPAVNAQIDEDQVLYHNYCDVSIAVSTPKGLVVPVIRNAESLNFEQIEKKIIELATKARDGKLTIEEMTGGTFTITNGGIFGSMLSTPIINAPQSAILGMHNIVQRPVVIDGEVQVRPIMYVALSYDHRIIDGRESVSFLYRVKELLEDPTRLLIGI